MSKEKNLAEIERIKSSLEYHFQKYKDYKYDSQFASRKNERTRASDNMYTHAKFIESELQNQFVFSEIHNGNPFQFENFERYVSSDLPGYLTKIESLLEKLKAEKEEE